jgi:hypothetical protein
MFIYLWNRKDWIIWVFISEEKEIEYKEKKLKEIMKR